MAGALSVQRILVALLFIPAFLVGAVFAPEKSPRWYFIIAAICEGLVFASRFLPVALPSLLSK